MELKDFLKVKKVRCVDGVAGITTGKVYDVIGLDETYVHVTDDDGEETHYWYCRFEPVLESAENPLRNIELTPELEASEPKFEVGNKVYFGFSKNIEEIERFCDFLGGIHAKSKSGNLCLLTTCCHATPENYEMLCNLYPHIEFKQPPKPLSGDDIVRAMLKKGIKNVLCLWGNGDKIIVDRLSYKGGLMSTNCNIVGGLTPIDWHTGEPLTESILND